MGCREGLCPFSGLWVLVDKNLLLGGLRQKPDAGWNLDKNRDKPRICFPSLRLAAENGGYPPTQNGDIRSLFWLFSLMALQN